MECSTGSSVEEIEPPEIAARTAAQCREGATDHNLAVLHRQGADTAIRPGMTDSIEFDNKIEVAVYASSYRSVRGYTVVTALCDEIAFWHNAEDSKNPDKEIVKSVTGGAKSTLPLNQGFTVCWSEVATSTR
jgi:hypothetical protein